MDDVMRVLDRGQREQGDRRDRPGPEETVAGARPRTRGGRPDGWLGRISIPRVPTRGAEGAGQGAAGPDQGQGGPGEDLAEQGGAVLPPGAAGEVLGPLGQA